MFNGKHVYNASVSIYKSIPVFASVLTYGLWVDVRLLSACLIVRSLSVLCPKHTVHHTIYKFWTRVAGSGGRNRKTQVHASQFQPAAAWSGWLRWSN